MDQPGKARGRRWAAWAWAWVLAALPAVAVAQSVHIGGTTLTLGAPKAQALGQARARFNLSATTQDGRYYLYPKVIPLGKSGGKPRTPQAVGSMTIARGELVRVTRILGSFRSSGGEAAIARLIQAFAQAPSQGRHPAIHTDSSRRGNATTTRVYFSYPDRAIQILVFKPADGSVKPTVEITEQYALGHPPPKPTPGNASRSPG